MRRLVIKLYDRVVYRREYPGVLIKKSHIFGGHTVKLDNGKTITGVKDEDLELEEDQD